MSEEPDFILKSNCPVCGKEVEADPYDYAEVHDGEECWVDCDGCETELVLVATIYEDGSLIFHAVMPGDDLQIDERIRQNWREYMAGGFCKLYGWWLTDGK